MKLKPVAGLLIGLALSSTVGAFAAGAVVDADDLGAGNAVVAECDPTTSDWIVAFGPSGAATMTSLTISNIALACGGKDAEVTVFGSGGASLDDENGTIPNSCPTMCSISFSINVPTTSVAGLAMVVSG